MWVRISKKTLRPSSTTPPKNRRRRIGRESHEPHFRWRWVLPLLRRNRLLETQQPPSMETNRPRLHSNTLRKPPRLLHTGTPIFIGGVVLTKPNLPQKERRQWNEYMKLYMKIYGYLKGDGCCLYCGEINPFMLNNHHIFGRKNSDFTITLCEDHHAPFTRGMPFVLTAWRPPPAK